MPLVAPLSAEELTAYIGEGGAIPPRFRQVHPEGRPGSSSHGYNPAAFLGLWWYLYRKMYGGRCSTSSSASCSAGPSSDPILWGVARAVTGDYPLLPAGRPEDPGGPHPIFFAVDAPAANAAHLARSPPRRRQRLGHVGRRRGPSCSSPSPLSPSGGSGTRSRRCASFWPDAPGPLDVNERGPVPGAPARSVVPAGPGQQSKYRKNSCGCGRNFTGSPPPRPCTRSTSRSRRW